MLKPDLVANIGLRAKNDFNNKNLILLLKLVSDVNTDYNY